MNRHDADSSIDHNTAAQDRYRWTLRERIVWRTSDWLYGWWLYLMGRV